MIKTMTSFLPALSKNPMNFLTLLGWGSVAALFLTASLTFIYKSITHYEGYVVEKIALENEVAHLQKTLNTQGEIQNTPGAKAFLEKAQNPFIKESFTGWILDMAQIHYCRTTIKSMDTQNPVEEKIILNIESVSDSDIFALLDTLLKRAHNGVVIHTFLIERTKDFSDDFFETALTQAQGEQKTNNWPPVFSATVELSLFHDMGGGNTAASIPHAEASTSSKNP